MSFPVPRHALALSLADSVVVTANYAHCLGGYGLLNLYTGWQFTPDWSLLVRLDNAAGKRYEPARFQGQRRMHLVRSPALRDLLIKYTSNACILFFKPGAGAPS